MFKLWNDVDNRVVNPLLFSDVAEQTAQTFERTGRGSQKRDGSYNYSRNKSSQIRKFYDEIQRYNSLSKNAVNVSDTDHQNRSWNMIHASLHMLIAKAAYAEGRKLTSPEFTTFIKSGVSQIKAPDDLKIFSDFFESVMGYYKLIGPK